MFLKPTPALVFSILCLISFGTYGTCLTSICRVHIFDLNTNYGSFVLDELCQTINDQVCRLLSFLKLVHAACLIFVNCSNQMTEMLLSIAKSMISRLILWSSCWVINLGWISKSNCDICFASNFLIYCSYGMSFCK